MSSTRAGLTMLQMFQLKRAYPQSYTRLLTKKRSSEIFCRKLGFQGPTNLFLKWASKSLIRP